MEAYAKRLIEKARKEGLDPVKDIKEVARLLYVEELEALKFMDSVKGREITKKLIGGIK